MNTLTSKEKLIPIITSIRESIPEGKDSTFECQLTIKNYDLDKDVRFDSNCKLPHKKRLVERILILADKALEEECIKLGIPKAQKREVPGVCYVPFEDLQGNTKEKMRHKRKLAMNCDSLISVPAFNKVFEMRVIVVKNKAIHTIKNVGDLGAMIEDLKNTIKFKLRKCVNIDFAFGNSQMTDDQAYENLSVALNHLAGLLKKGLHNVKSIYVKGTKTKPVKLY